MTAYILTNWEQDFIKMSVEREFDIHHIDNWETEHEFNNHTTKLQELAHKFKVDYLDE